jgi:hypothetical protein
LLDDGVFDRTLEIGFLSFPTSSPLLSDLEKLLNELLVLLSGFGEFVT